jgi:hypothetical protein
MSIKHLKPRSEEEIENYFRSLSPPAKLIEGSTDNNLKLIKRAVKEGADIHWHNDFTLQNAAWYGHYNIVKFLLNAGADVHADDDRALKWARVDLPDKNISEQNKTIKLLEQYTNEH